MNVSTLLARDLSPNLMKRALMAATSRSSSRSLDACVEPSAIRQRAAAHESALPVANAATVMNGVTPPQAMNSGSDSSEPAGNRSEEMLYQRKSSNDCSRPSASMRASMTG